MNSGQVNRVGQWKNVMEKCKTQISDEALIRTHAQIDTTHSTVCAFHPKFRMWKYYDTSLSTHFFSFHCLPARCLKLVSPSAGSSKRRVRLCAAAKTWHILTVLSNRSSVSLCNSCWSFFCVRFFALCTFSGIAFRTYEFNKVPDGRRVIARLAIFHLTFNNVPLTDPGVLGKRMLVSAVFSPFWPKTLEKLCWLCTFLWEVSVFADQFNLSSSYSP